MPNSATPARQWRFFRAGGFDQVRLESGADLLNLDQLDQKLWVALACPTTGLEFDPKTLELIDTDHDGRIRAPELIAAIRWAGAMLKNPDDLVRGGDSLPVWALSDATDEGKRLLASARLVLANLGKKDATTIALADVADAGQIFSSKPLNGDGVVLPESAADDATKTVIDEIIACVGSVPDRSGKPGIDPVKADAFFEECAAFDGWMKQAEMRAAEILPAGQATGAASAAVKAIKTKVDDYFGRCRLAAYDPRAAALLNRKEEDYLAVAANDLSITAAEIAHFPLAPVAAGKPLPLSGAVNPAHAAAVATLRAAAVQPLLGEKSELTEADWSAVQARLGPYEVWSAAKAGAAVEKLGISRVREILGATAKAKLAELIAQDKALEPEASSIGGVEKLIRYVRDLHKLCINFVNFKDLYGGGEMAIFQRGTLYLDQRSCHLCLPVADAARHASLAALAGTYLAYCDCVRKGTGEKQQIVAAFTNGDSDNLMVGRNGVFYDRKGRDWDATITKIVDNPISIRQAFWSPYKKLVRLIEEQVAKRAASAEKASDAKLSSAATVAATADKGAHEPRKVDVGTVAALGVAFGALMTAFASIAAYALGLLKLPFWEVCLALIGLLLVISGPSMIIAWLKLRKRNLGPILDANGWAVNARAKINVPFGTSLTGVAKLPPNASLSTGDRFGERPSFLPKFALFIVILCFLYSLLNSFYLIDLIAVRATGHHWGKQRPAERGNPEKNPSPDKT
jgi:hypothetical protein